LKWRANDVGTPQNSGEKEAGKGGAEFSQLSSFLPAWMREQMGCQSNNQAKNGLH